MSLGERWVITTPLALAFRLTVPVLPGLSERFKRPEEPRNSPQDQVAGSLSRLPSKDEEQSCQLTNRIGPSQLTDAGKFGETGSWRDLFPL